MDNGPSLEKALTDPTIEAAVVDVRLPPTFTNEGLAAAITARTLRPGFPVMVLSRHVETQYAQRLLASGEGAVGYLLKDRVAHVDSVVDGVRQVTSGGTVHDPEVVAGLVSGAGREQPLERLTAREREVLTLMAAGSTRCSRGSRPERR